MCNTHLDFQGDFHLGAFIHIYLHWLVLIIFIDLWPPMNKRKKKETFIFFSIFVLQQNLNYQITQSEDAGITGPLLKIHKISIMIFHINVSFKKKNEFKLTKTRQIANKWFVTIFKQPPPFSNVIHI